MNTVTFTVHQRPFYLRMVLEKWKQVRMIKDWHVHFHIDPSAQQAVQEEICDEFARWHGGYSEICSHTKKYGVLENPLHAMTTAFDFSEYVVLAEEDVEVSSDVLEYFTFAARQKRLLAACAWSDADGNPDEAVRRKWFNPWCWGTTDTMFHHVIHPTWDLDYSTEDERGPAGWDCNLGLRVVHDKNLECLFPEQARARHIGKWLGVHQDPSKFGAVEEPPSFKSQRGFVAWKEKLVN